MKKILERPLEYIPTIIKLQKTQLKRLLRPKMIKYLILPQYTLKRKLLHTKIARFSIAHIKKIHYTDLPQTFSYRSSSVRTLPGHQLRAFCYWLCYLPYCLMAVFNRGNVGHKMMCLWALERCENLINIKEIENCRFLLCLTFEILLLFLSAMQ